ncbi:MAG TPA: thioesterase domain-containing protein, partial [Thermoanaerobaculia bacterium]|nr:thioesterase domain-containing protein [Thermoanaerobaculia bacterium]
HPSVRDCAVLAREGALVAYTAGGSDAAALRSFLGERLPDYMVPTAWVALESLPLTPNGKIDRRALPAPERASGPEHLGPRDDLEWQVVRIWEEVLGVHPVGVRDDFFSLGGHSLLAARLTLSLRQRLGRSLPLAAVLRHPTVEGLAALLRQEIGPLPRSPLVELAPGDGKPLFLIHPVGGEVLCYVPLARRLGRPVQGLQAPEESLTTLEEMADLYLRHVRAAQPEGPYALGGWSLGGVVAFEMARQLEARGETVERVVLIDSFAPGATAEEPLSGGALVASFTHDLARLLGLGLAGAPAGLAGLETDAALRRLCEQAQGMGILPPGMELADLEQRFSTFAANHRAMARYRGGPANAPLLLIRAGEPASGEPDRGWSRLSGNPVEVDEIPGDHYALLREPAVERLASLLRERARMASA